jgi:hypothetical protein
MRQEADERKGQKRSFQDDTHPLKTSPIKRKYPVNFEDLIYTMKKDKHLKRSTLLYKALDKSLS